MIHEQEIGDNNADDKKKKKKKKNSVKVRKRARRQ